MSATIRDVAKLAGVSISTVSLVLNNKDGVSDETAQKVNDAIRKLGYRPNAIAKGLAQKRMNTIGFVIPYSTQYVISDPFLPTVLRSITSVANARGFDVLLVMSSEYGEDISYIQLLKERKMDGAIVICPRVNEYRLLELRDQGYPFVVIGRPFESEGINYVDTDNYGSAYLATKYLLDRGYERIAMVTPGPLKYTVALDRLEGYKKALEDSGRLVLPDYIAEGDYRQGVGYEAMKKCLSRWDIPDAVFVGGDTLVLGVLEAIVERGLRVPEDIGVICYDFDLAKNLDPPLTAIVQPLEELGRIAAETLSRLLKEDGMTRDPLVQEVLPSELVVRGSCR